MKILMFLPGAGIFAAGALRYAHSGFGYRQAALCLLAIPCAMLALLVLDYTLHHARIVGVMTLAAILLLLYQFPGFCIGLGLGWTGILLAQWEKEPLRQG